MANIRFIEKKRNIIRRNKKNKYIICINYKLLKSILRGRINLFVLEKKKKKRKIGAQLFTPFLKYNAAPWRE